MSGLLVDRTDWMEKRDAITLPDHSVTITQYSYRNQRIRHASQRTQAIEHGIEQGLDDVL